MTRPRTARPRTVRSRLERLAREIAKFGAVGAIGFVVNFIVFNICVHGFGLAVVRSGVIATAVAIGTNYIGNRYWTYRHDSDKNRRSRELSLFLLFSGIGLVIENGVLALSHYGLGLTTPLADNVAKNVIGLGLGTVFRFWSYRTWVFRTLPARTAVVTGDVFAVETAESFLAVAPPPQPQRVDAAK
ncbi:GtrA family protein [Streptomyces sp. SCA3-4]|uniref:GtrA family protein n=1 Tax=Streptomyces sichuanensis TaxID=2871810 RepID=UPI001CE342D0|nr:GtrA family protein [Streptomyces sichuanensis]MCA6093653.1 GtrA family protein [Streptomyces sichuanensis]